MFTYFSVGIFILTSMFRPDQFYKNDTVSKIEKSIDIWGDNESETPYEPIVISNVEKRYWFSVNDPNFDNFDNPYGKFVL